MAKNQKEDLNQEIYIFYILVSEEKNKKLKMQGPFIHRKPEEKEPDEKRRFIFKKEDYFEEKRFLSKWLRERKPNMTSLFHYINAESLDEVNVECKCGNNFNNKAKENEIKYKCSVCDRIISVPDIKTVLDNRQQSAMLKAYEFFEDKFQQMEQNYKICMRKR